MHLSRAVLGRVLVSDIGVRVQPGEVLAVVGPSGAVKSSFLRLLNRLDEPTGGAVCLNGQDYRDLAPRELRRRVGMVRQVAYLFPGTVAETVAFGPRQNGERLSSEQISALLKRVGLPGYQMRDVSKLSGGEAQRVSLARALANAPEALLLDEPASALDEVSARGIEELVRSIIRERRMTCVIVTHNTAQARRISDRTMILEGGKLVRLVPRRRCYVIAELLNNLNSDIVMGMAQAAGAMVLCAAVVLPCRRFAVHVERETAISVMRGLVLMMFVGMVLAVLLHGNLLVGMLILLAMTFAAAITASRRAQDVKGSLLLSFYAIAAGSGVAIAGMLATGTLTSDIAVLVPVGSMIIANAMNACAQSVERFRADVTARVGQIESGLALGADPSATVAPYVQSAVYASLLPRLDMLSRSAWSGYQA
jgi:putative ABC transport system ATP-binding protein